MGDIYANAIFTIAAEGASTADIGLYPSRTPFDVEPRSCPLFRDASDACVWVKVEAPDWVASVGESVLQQRAWVLQERLMSRRLIHFTQHGIFWECAELSASAFEPEGTETGGLMNMSVMIPNEQQIPTGSEPETDIILQWAIMMFDYSGRKLSFTTDKFPAISAIASRIGSMTGDKYLAGLWKSRLFEDLMWSGMSKFPEHRYRTYDHANGGHGTYIAPSWSWASVFGGAVSHDTINDRYRLMARVVSVFVQPTNPDNPYGLIDPGAKLRLQGRMRHGVRAIPQDISDDETPWHDLRFSLPNGDPLATNTTSTTSEHAGIGSVWFDVAGAHTSQPFTVVLMAETKARANFNDDEVIPNTGFKGTTSMTLLIAPVEGADGAYMRIGQANVSGINFFVGCEEEVVELI
jgi:hypothetical protein